MKEKFIEIYQIHIKRPGAEKLLEWLEKSGFFTDPASTRRHLSCPGGLCTHSVHVYSRLRDLYLNDMMYRLGSECPESLTEEEEEKIAIVGLLHDVCKVGCYPTEMKNVKTYDPEKVKAALPKEVKRDSAGEFVWVQEPRYTFNDPLPYGHGEKSVYIVSGFMRLSREEAFAIRWHMGAWDEAVRNIGNTYAQFPLALLVHLADMMATHIDEVEKNE